MRYFFYCSFCNKVIKKFHMKSKNVVYIPVTMTHIHKKSTYILRQINHNEALFLLGEKM